MSPARKKSVKGHETAPKAVRASLKEYRRKRDFEVTAEPSGDRSAARKGKSLAFVIQKHSASHLHFDVRLEVDGVMKSWAVPKGPSVDPAIKRLAMEVEDHPIAYNTFEGTIPQGEYGGGTVMLWDRGTWTPDEVNAGESDNEAARRALTSDKLAFTFHGKRLHGSFALVRTRRGEERAQWLLIKHKDKYAKSGGDIVERVITSVDTGRTMEEIAAADNEELGSLESAGGISPMLSTKSKLPLPVGEFAIEPLPDGERVLVFLTNGTVKLVDTGKARSKRSDLLHDSPNVQAALLRIARHRKGALVLDAFLDGDELVVVDLLLCDDDLLVQEPWIERRLRLEEVFPDLSALAHGAPVIRLNHWESASAYDVEDAARQVDARKIVAKRIDSPYESGASKLWLCISV